MDSKYLQEIGPDEDYNTVMKGKLAKVIDVDDPAPGLKLTSGIYEVDRDSLHIQEFLADVPLLIKRDEACGLIWDKKLQPADHKYEEGEHYLSTREIGKQSVHGTVSFYRDGATGVKFAIKTLQSDSFRQEEVIIGLKNQHPNICSVFGIILRDRCIHILQEHAGSPLIEERAWIAEDASRMLSFAKQSFQALDVVHKYGFVHCDIKPDNIVISRNENGVDFTVKLIDFGSCQKKGTALSKNCYTTPFYWCPEIWQAVDNKEVIMCWPEVDVYALALTFYFVQTSLHLVQNFRDQDKRNLMISAPDDLVLIALPETIPSELRSVMKQCLAGKRENRMTAEEGMNHLIAEDTPRKQMQPFGSEENYRDSLNSLTKIFSQYGNSRINTPQTLAADVGAAVSLTSALSQTSNERNSIQYFVGSSKGIEKREREFKSYAKGRQGLAGSKLSRPTKKSKYTKQISKTFPPQMPTLASTSKPLVGRSPQTELDSSSYVCSSLLKELALRAQPTTHKPDFFQQTGDSKHKKINTEKVETLHSANKHVPSVQIQNIEGKRHETGGEEDVVALKQSSCCSYKFSGNKPESDIQVKKKFKDNNEKGAVGKIGEVVEQLSSEATDIAVNPSLEGDPTSELIVPFQKHKVSKGGELGMGDDMAFVFEAFDNNVGDDNDILNSWCKLLDEDEQAMDVEINETDVEESMDSGAERYFHTSTNSSGNATFENVLSRGNRKRIADREPDPSEVPGKVAFSSTQQLETKDQQLPNFDQILPESH